ncbi:MAG: N-acetyltransferase [Hyphomicrobium sp.]
MQSAKFALIAPFTVRQERASEIREIHEFVRKAFASAHYAEGDEQDFVYKQRNEALYLPELTLVLEDSGRLIAHVMLTQTAICTAIGLNPILLLACVAVATEYRNRGVGTAFIEVALQRAFNLGHAAVILVGDPTYYRRLGFVPSSEFGITNKNGIEPHHVQVRELVPGALRGASGSILLPS